MPLGLEQYLRPDVIQKVARLDLKARFIVEGFLSGLHSSPYHGFSVEFSEHRKYVPGDDVKQIDWKVFAKTDRFYIKKYEAETNLEAYLLVDCSASMDFATGGRMTKMDYAICLAAALGYMMVHQQDPVGLVTFDEKVRDFLPPRAKTAQLTSILSTLAATRPARGTDIAAALHEFAQRVRRRGLVILLSDLLGDQDEVVKGLHHVSSRGHDLIVFQVLDHSELTFDFDGEVEFVEPETSQTVTADPRHLRVAYQAEVRRFIDEYKRQCRRLRADMVTVDTAETFDKALVEFLAGRKTRF